MTTAYDVPKAELVKSLSDKLKKKKITPPKYARYVKTGSSKESQPMEDDWWYTRCASILRKIYQNGPIGVNRLTKLYSSKTNPGMRPERKNRGSGSIVKDALTQLEAMELVKKSKKGRELTSKGVSFMDKTSHEIKKTIPELKKY